MNGRMAKKLQKKVYGDVSLKSPRRYSHIGGTIANIGKRQEYQDTKKDYYSGEL
jgi:hypothetical protein